MNRLRSLLRMRGMLLGYSFQPRPNSCALATAGSVMNNGCSQSQFDEREQDRHVQKFRLQRPQSFNAIQAEALFYPLTQEGRKRLYSQGGSIVE